MRTSTGVGGVGGAATASGKLGLTKAGSILNGYLSSTGGAGQAGKAGGAASASSESLPSPLQGTVLKVAVEQGAEVSEGDLICVIEAMKMENEIAAHRSGKVTALNVAEGAAVSSGDVLAVIE